MLASVATCGQMPLPRYSETALKARYCAQMMAAASVLAGTAPDDFRRRVVARWVFVYCHEFIRRARRAKNELRGRGGMRDTVRELERALNELEKRDWRSYETIRHRIAAHRQTYQSPTLRATPAPTPSRSSAKASTPEHPGQSASKSTTPSKLSITITIDLSRR